MDAKTKLKKYDAPAVRGTLYYPKDFFRKGELFVEWKVDHLVQYAVFSSRIRHLLRQGKNVSRCIWEADQKTGNRFLSFAFATMMCSLRIEDGNSPYIKLFDYFPMLSQHDRDMVIRVLRKRCKSGKSWERSMAAVEIGRGGVFELSRELAALCRDGNLGVRLEAELALEGLVKNYTKLKPEQKETAALKIERLAKNKRPKIRRAVAKAIGDARIYELLPVINRLGIDRDYDIACEFLDAIKKIILDYMRLNDKEKKAVEHNINDMSVSGSAAIKEAVSRSVGRSGMGNAFTIIEYLTYDPQQNVAAAAVLGMGDFLRDRLFMPREQRNRIKGRLIDLSVSSSPEIRRAVSKVVSENMPAELAGLLKALVRDGDPEVAGNAIKGLIRLYESLPQGSKDKKDEILNVLLDVKENSPNERVVSFAVIGIGKLLLSESLPHDEKKKLAEKLENTENIN